MLKSRSLLREKKAFDHQIGERLKHGFLPDLRRARKCNYFYNNPWRHPGYVQLDFGEQFRKIYQALIKFSSKDNVSILEVGCGAGYMSLELAREGFNVTGIDISPLSIKTAKKVSDDDPWRKKRGKLEYLCTDFFSYAKNIKHKFGAILFLGALHHFKNQNRVMDNIRRLLIPQGLVIVHEPTRDRVSEGNAAFVYLVELLLSLKNGFYRKNSIPKNSKEYYKRIKETLSRLKYEGPRGGKRQSVNDNQAGHLKMYGSLCKNFHQLHYEECSAFFHEVIGGLRFDEKTNLLLAAYLKQADKHLCSLHLLQSTEFFFLGRKHK